MSRKIPASIKIALGAAVIVGLGFGGWKLYSSQRLKDFVLTEIPPGRVNLVAVQPGTGWRIIVSNSMAQLAEVTGLENSSGDEDVQNGKRLPMREFIDSLRGNGDSLGYLIEKLADITDESIPERAPRWKVADIEKAIAGDPVLKQKLEADLQCKLDGKPVDELSISSIVNGIVIEVPVEVTLSVGGKGQKVVGTVREPFMSDIGEKVAKAISTKFNPKTEYVVGLYVDEGMKILNGGAPKEDVIQGLRSRYSPGRVKSLAAKPEFLLQNSTVLISDAHLEGATVETYQAGNKTFADITLALTDEGKMRLWKYSHDNPGFQLLLVVDGLAYSAPRISGELVEKYIQITRMSEPDLAKEATDKINWTVKERSK